VALSVYFAGTLLCGCSLLLPHLLLPHLLYVFFSRVVLPHWLSPLVIWVIAVLMPGLGCVLLRHSAALRSHSLTHWLTGSLTHSLTCSVSRYLPVSCCRCQLVVAWLMVVEAWGPAGTWTQVRQQQQQQQQQRHALQCLADSNWLPRRCCYCIAARAMHL
jgi:hypothetical protein